MMKMITHFTEMLTPKVYTFFKHLLDRFTMMC